MYNAYITKLKKVEKHPNADRLQIAECFGNSVIVGMEAKEGDIVCYFPTDGRLGEEYAIKNKLLRTKNEDGTYSGYIDADKRQITTLKLRGAKSDGLIMPLSSFEGFCKVSDLKEGDLISVLNGVTICEKYIPKRNPRRSSESNGKNNTKSKKKSSGFEFFKEHIDTAQFAYNKHEFKVGDIIQITLKMHGTSARSAYSIKTEEKNLNPLFKKLAKLVKYPTVKKTWEYVCGTRRVTLDNFDNGYYGSDAFRKVHHDKFVGKLMKGEEVFYEIVGFTQNGGLIMPECNNEKTKDKEFIKQYGKTTQFTYGCESPNSEIYVYRMNMTNEDGYVVEYSPEQIKTRCEQMAVNVVPEFETFVFTTIEDLEERVNRLCDGVDPTGKSHTKEGCVVRILNRNSFKVFKHKNFNFKVLEGIAKADDILDMEEAGEA